MKIHWGYDTWQGVVDVLMTAAGANEWTATITPPSTAAELDFVFLAPGGSGDVWDNNNSADWKVALLASAPRASWLPAPPVAGQPMTITYLADQGILIGASQIYIHRGFNGWATPTIAHSPMTKGVGETWTITYDVPAVCSSAEFVFADGLEGVAGVKWDNNNGQDWIIPVSGGGAPAWGLSTTQLSPITYQGANPQDWSFQIWNAGQGTLEWTLAKQAQGQGTGWFNLSASSGSSAGAADKTTVRVSFSVDGLTTPGTYSAQIIASHTGGLLTPAVIGVQLTLKSLNNLSVAPSSVEFAWADSTTLTTTLYVRNLQPDNMAFQARVLDAENHSWLTISPEWAQSLGSNYPAVPVIVTAKTAGLSENLYQAQIEIAGADAANSPQIIPVRLGSAPSAKDLWLLH